MDGRHLKAPPKRLQDSHVPFSGVASWDEDSDPDSAAEFSLLASELTSFNLGGLCRETKMLREGCLRGPGRPNVLPRWPSARHCWAEGCFLPMASLSKICGPIQTWRS